MCKRSGVFFPKFIYLTESGWTRMYALEKKKKKKTMMTKYKMLKTRPDSFAYTTLPHSHHYNPGWDSNKTLFIKTQGCPIGFSLLIWSFKILL